MRFTTRLAVDRTIKLDVNGSAQHLRICAARAGLAPLLTVQGGPALPLLHEVGKFQRLLKLEEDFLVATGINEDAGRWQRRTRTPCPGRSKSTIFGPC